MECSSLDTLANPPILRKDFRQCSVTILLMAQRIDSVRFYSKLQSSKMLLKRSITTQRELNLTLKKCLFVLEIVSAHKTESTKTYQHNRVKKVAVPD